MKKFRVKDPGGHVYKISLTENEFYAFLDRNCYNIFDSHTGSEITDFSEIESDTREEYLDLSSSHYYFEFTWCAPQE